ncbi:MAG: hypothetical protein ABI137_08215 [Antricoccus sp.]
MAPPATQAVAADAPPTLTVVTLVCNDYQFIYANRSRNNIQETFKDLGPDSPYFSDAAPRVNPHAEQASPQGAPNCAPMPIPWNYTLGTGISGGNPKDLSVVTGASNTPVQTTLAGVPELDRLGNPTGATLQGATTITLTPDQRKLAGNASSLWIQGGTPAARPTSQLNGQADTYAFGALRCGYDALNGDNVEYIQYKNDDKNIFCYAIYVSPPPSSGVIVVKKVLQNPPSGKSVSFPFQGDVSFEQGGNFAVNTTGGQGSVSFARAASADRTGGTPWSVNELPSPGYAFVSLSCTSLKGTPVSTTNTAASISLLAGDTVTCTYTNRPLSATLTLVKKVTNTSGGTAVPINWTLTASGASTITGSTGSAAVTNQRVGVGTYNLSESGGPVGYTPSDWACTGAGASTSSTVTLQDGNNATCTITNTDKPATLTLIKTVTNNNGGTATPADWTLSATGPTTITGVTGTPAVTAAPVTAGSYTLSEAGGPAGYTPSAWTCITPGNPTTTGSTVILSIGQATTCTINNTDQPATLTLVKKVTNTNGGIATPADWTLSATGPTSITGVTGTPAVTAAQVQAGSFTLSEAGGPAGYTPSAWTCIQGNTTTTGSTIVLSVGQATTCTITNTDQPATLTLIKTVDNGTTGGKAVATDWILTATGPTTITGTTGTPAVTAAPVTIGTYTLSEADGPSAYAASDWTCTQGETTTTGSTVVLSLGQATTCTITNTAKPATLTLVKKVDNTNGGTATPTDWTLTATGPTTITGTTGAAAVTSASVTIGSYTLSEAGGPTGYAASSWTCTGATVNGAQVTVTLGNSVTCTITNTKQALVPPTTPPAPLVHPVALMSGLPNTGFGLLPPLLTALALLLTGAFALTLGRRRRNN